MGFSSLFGRRPKKSPKPEKAKKEKKKKGQKAGSPKAATQDPPKEVTGETPPIATTADPTGGPKANSAEESKEVDELRRMIADGGESARRRKEAKPAAKPLGKPLAEASPTQQPSTAPSSGPASAAPKSAVPVPAPSAPSVPSAPSAAAGQTGDVQFIFNVDAEGVVAIRYSIDGITTLIGTDIDETAATESAALTQRVIERALANSGDSSLSFADVSAIESRALIGRVLSLVTEATVRSG